MKLKLSDGYTHLNTLLTSMGCDQIDRNEYEIRTDKLLQILQLANTKDRRIDELEKSYNRRMHQFSVEWLHAIAQCRAVSAEDRKKAQAEYERKMKEEGYEYNEAYGWRQSGERVGD